MITIHELLKDKHYKKFLCTAPKLPPLYTQPDSLPWRVIIMKKGEEHWRIKRYATYHEAFRALKAWLPHISDGTINCPALDFRPPTKSVLIRGQYIMVGGRKVQKSRTVVWTAKLPFGENEDHHWCPYCRRPTVFRRMSRHVLLPAKKLGGVPLDNTLFRCLMCGASENLVNMKDPAAHQKWEAALTTPQRKRNSR